MTKRGVEETIIIRNSKMVYAVRLGSKQEENSRGDRNNNPYLIVEDGKIKFIDRIYDSKAEFNFSDEVHQIAKEVFIGALRNAIKEKLLQLKQLELILSEMGLKDCLGDAVTVNAQLLVESKESKADGTDIQD